MISVISVYRRTGINCLDESAHRNPERRANECLFGLICGQTRDILKCIALASSQGSDEPVHTHSPDRAFPTNIHNLWGDEDSDPKPKTFITHQDPSAWTLAHV